MTKTLTSVSLASLIFIHLHNALLLVMIDLEVSWKQRLVGVNSVTCASASRVPAAAALAAAERSMPFAFAICAQQRCPQDCRRHSVCAHASAALYSCLASMWPTKQGKEAGKSALASVNSGQGGSTVLNFVPGPSL